MKFMTTKRAVCAATALAFLSTGVASAQDNPLLQQNTVSTESSFEQQARAIDLAATKAASDPVCQNIRANYDQELAKIVEKSGSNDGGMSLSKINQTNRNVSGTSYRLGRMSRNLGVNSGSALGKAAGTFNRGASVANDAAAIGSLLGIGGKMSQKKAQKKAAKLDAQAMDAVKQTGCPMTTFN